MKWSIPAKTFMLGEYVALNGGPSILLLTAPAFTLTVTSEPGLKGIHPDSPAGRFWLAGAAARHQGLSFEDPYQGLGGLGASSAQFVGAYQAYCAIQAISFTQRGLLESYRQYAVTKQGIIPSGYDVLAQTASKCVYINRNKKKFEVFEWPFKNLHFALLHTGEKCQTHQHLASLTAVPSADLAIIVQQAKTACIQQDACSFIDAINHYHHLLLALGLMSQGSNEKVQILRQHPGVLAAKGCGAMGADVIFVVLEKQALAEMAFFGLRVLAASEIVSIHGLE